MLDDGFCGPGTPPEHYCALPGTIQSANGALGFVLRKIAVLRHRFWSAITVAGILINSSIGGHVDIGAGAKIIGPVNVGDHARIGANAVVRKDVPPYGVFVAPDGQLLPPK